VRCVAALLEFCYIARRDELSMTELDRLGSCLQRFHTLRGVFVEAGVRSDMSLPRQHALCHYVNSITLFGSPNGLCSSITEAKHIKSVKEPWRRSSRNKPLPQMTQTIERIEKMQALRALLQNLGVLPRSARHYVNNLLRLEDVGVVSDDLDAIDENVESERGKVTMQDVDGAEASDDPVSDTTVKLASHRRTFYSYLALRHY
jgi:hypothetical protein